MPATPAKFSVTPDYEARELLLRLLKEYLKAYDVGESEHIAVIVQDLEATPSTTDTTAKYGK